MACGSGNGECLEVAGSLFLQFLSGGAITPDMRDNAYQYVRMKDEMARESQHE